eukprot:UN07691
MSVICVRASLMVCVFVMVNNCCKLHCTHYICRFNISQTIFIN